MIDFNGAQAAIRAGYSKRSAAVISAQNLTKPNIKEYLAELEFENASKHQLTLDSVMEELRSIAFNQNERTSDRIKALEILGKHIVFQGELLGQADQEEKEHVVIYLPDNGRDLNPALGSLTAINKIEGHTE